MPEVTTLKDDEFWRIKWEKWTRSSWWTFRVLSHLSMSPVVEVQAECISLPWPPFDGPNVHLSCSHERCFLLRGSHPSVFERTSGLICLPNSSRDTGESAAFLTSDPVHVTTYLTFCSLFHTKVNSPCTETLPQSRYDSLWQGPAAVRASNKRQAAAFNGSPISVTAVFSRSDWGIVAWMQEWCSECQAWRHKRHINVTPTTKSARDLGPAVHFCLSHRDKNTRGPESCSELWFPSFINLSCPSKSYFPSKLRRHFSFLFFSFAMMIGVGGCGRQNVISAHSLLNDFIQEENKDWKHFSSPKSPHQFHPISSYKSIFYAFISIVFWKFPPFPHFSHFQI